MRFLADMGISLKVVELLRDQGHDALHLHEEGLRRLPDIDILRKACKEECILLTHDLDFGATRAGKEYLSECDHLPSTRHAPRQCPSAPASDHRPTR